MTNIQLQTKLKQYPDDWPVAIELNDEEEAVTVQESSALFVGTSHAHNEILIHNDPTYQQP